MSLLHANIQQLVSMHKYFLRKNQLIDAFLKKVSNYYTVRPITMEAMGDFSCEIEGLLLSLRLEIINM